MRRSFAIPSSTKKLRSRGCGTREFAGASTDTSPGGFFLRGAGRAVSVLTWIACAVAPFHGRAEGDATRMAREMMVREQIAGRGVKNAAVLAALRRVPRHARKRAPPRL